MSNHVYKKIELTGSSPNSVEEAVNTAVARAAKTVHNLRWFEVDEIRGHIENNKVAHWQVTVKIGFTLEDSTSKSGSSSGKGQNEGDPRFGKPEID